MIFILAFVVLLVSVLLALLVVKDYRRKKRERDSATWKLTSFHGQKFAESEILSCMKESNVIGKGGAGKVYLGALKDSGEFVAVKKINNQKKLNSTLEKQFMAETEILGQIRHRNIVKLWCYISGQDANLLVYEYMENQSLDGCLHARKRRPISGVISAHQVVLDWPTRLQIAIGAARGLRYLHHDCSPPIIHRDVKSSNILLDSEFKAKIGDFGLAKMLVTQGDPQSMSRVVGTFGYLAPEYINNGELNEKTDIYSFGVVLLELVTGKEPVINKDLNLAAWAWQHYAKKKPKTWPWKRYIKSKQCAKKMSIGDVFDQQIKEPHYLEEMTNVFKLALCCTNPWATSRPSMEKILQILHRPNGVETAKEVDVAPLLGAAKEFYNY